MHFNSIVWFKTIHYFRLLLINKVLLYVTECEIDVDLFASFLEECREVKSLPIDEKTNYKYDNVPEFLITQHKHLEFPGNKAKISFLDPPTIKTSQLFSHNRNWNRFLFEKKTFFTHPDCDHVEHCFFVP